MACEPDALKRADQREWRLREVGDAFGDHEHHRQNQTRRSARQNCEGRPSLQGCPLRNLIELRQALPDAE